MTTPQAAEKERAKALLREQRDREREAKEKERLARIDKMQRAQSNAATASTSAASRPSRSSADRDPDDDADSDNETAEEAAANKKEYQQKIVQLWKDKAKKPPRIGGPIRFKTVLRNTILDVFRGDKSAGNFGWTESHSETDWDIFWTNKEWIRCIYDKIHLDHNQKVNHFRNFYELTRKDLLVKNLKRSKRSLAKKGRESEGEEYDFFPDTYSLPAEYSLFVEAFKKTPGISWIMKPIGSSQGKGIFLFERLAQISEWKNDYSRSHPSSSAAKAAAGGSGANGDDASAAEKYIVQRYLSDPLLIGGKKFDLRIYVLVTSYAPLTAYMYREGFARFSSTRFTMVKGDLNNNYVHLTNVAIQKKGDDYDADSGGKWDVRSLKLYLLSKYGAERVNALFFGIQLICIRSLLSVQKVIINDKHSFEMYGYDILIDADLKPWLIEVNASPSLTANTPKDYEMKLALLQDTIAIVDIEKKLTGLEDQVGGYDLIYRGGFVKFNSNCTFTTYLGCHNNRERQLKKMWRAIRAAKKKESAAAAAAQAKADEEAAKAEEHEASSASAAGQPHGSPSHASVHERMTRGKEV